MAGRRKNECDGVGCSRTRKNKVIVESNLHLLLEVVRIFEVLEFARI